MSTARGSRTSRRELPANAGVPQPRAVGAAAGVSQNRANIELRLGTFNFGMQQPMIDSQQWARQHCGRFETCLATLVDDGELDVLFGCEVGGHKQGLSKERLRRSINAFASGDVDSLATQNYIRAWNFGVQKSSGAAQPAGVQMRLRSTALRTLSSPVVEPQLIIDTFHLEEIRGADRLQSWLVVGNLHVRTPGRRAPSIVTRIRLVKEALKAVGDVANSVDQPLVCQVLVGDVNLRVKEAETSVAELQPREVQSSKWVQYWQILPSSAGLGGANKTAPGP